MDNDGQQFERFRGQAAVSPQGEDLGRIEGIYTDDMTNIPKWVTVNEGPKHVRFVPLHGAQSAGDNLQLAWDRARVEGSPKIHVDSQINVTEEAELFSYYGVNVAVESVGTTESLDTNGTVDHPASGIVRTEKAVAEVGGAEPGEVRLRRIVVEEETVPVRS